MSRDEFVDLAFEEDVRALLHRAADPVQPDPAGWHRLQRRIHRRRTAVRTGTFALAGAAAAVVAIAVVSTGPDTADVELGPGGLATQPPGVTATATPDPPATTSPTDPAPAPSGTALGLLYTDGDSIHLADLEGMVRSTPAQGEGTSTITDLAVRPGGSTADFTMAYRFEPTGPGPATCGDLSWARVVEGVGNVAGGGVLPAGDAVASGGCLGAPMFSSDGAWLLWTGVAEQGELSLSAIRWSDDGPVDGTLVTFGLDLGAIRGADLSAVGLPVGADSGTPGTLLLRTDDGALVSLPIEVQADGALALPQAVPDAVVLDGVGGVVVDADGTWSAVRLPAQDAEDRVGLAFGHPRGTLTAETPLLLTADATMHLSVIGDTAVAGVGGATVLARVDGPPDAPTGISLDVDTLPPSRAAVLLPARAVDPEASAVPPPSADGSTPDEMGTAIPASPNPVVIPTAAPTSTPPADPTATPTSPPASATMPDQVRDMAMAIRDAAASRDWDRVAALIPDSGFTSNYGGQTDHVAFYRQEEANGIDVLGTLQTLLSYDPIRTEQGVWVWPDDYAASEYLGYRVGITDDGTWIFYVAGD